MIEYYVDEYIYLGQVISTTDQMSREIQRRTSNAWKKYWSLKEVMKDKQLHIGLKTKIFESCILPVLTYGCQTWALTKAELAKLKTCQHSMERSMLCIGRSDRIRNSIVRERTQTTDICEKVKTSLKIKVHVTGE